MTLPSDGKSLFPHLFSTFELRGVRFPNRTAMAPMSTGLATEDGHVTPQQIGFYEARAKGGTGLIIVEVTCTDAAFGRSEFNQLRLETEDQASGHVALVDAIRRHGAVAGIQLHLPGRHVDPRTTNGALPVAPSDVFSTRDPKRQIARALTSAEIRRLVESYADAASLAAKAGYQLIEIHGAHGYLPMAFQSARSNRRDDEWGGGREARMRFPCEVVRAVRAAIGPDRVLCYRLSSSEQMPGGITIEDTEQAVPLLVSSGVDVFNVSSGSMEKVDAITDPMSGPEGWRLPETRRVRKAAGVPVMAVGFRWPERAEAALAAGDADVITLGRPLLADADWVSKAAVGRMLDIRPCTNCNWCVNRAMTHQPVGCAENPETVAARSSNRTGNAEPAIVVGAGPGGMTAALELDRLGYEVILYEMRSTLGGGLISSAAPPHKEKLGWYLRHLEHRVSRSGVQVRLGQNTSAPAVVRHAAAVVILATGGAVRPLDIPGMDTGPVISAYELLMGDVDLKAWSDDAPVLVYGGGETGCETAEWLAERGRRVVLVTRSKFTDLARGAERLYRKDMLGRLMANPKIEVRPETSIERIDGRSVHLRSAGGSSTLRAAGIVMAQGRGPQPDLERELRALGVDVRRAGDCREIGRIGDAVHDAYNTVHDWHESRQGRSAS
jgi:2,4-dienoyl-CoA reductase-like NADH-dependent reductase (Old Yellow Enzyme family)/thioredoxin reductase